MVHILTGFVLPYNRCGEMDGIVGSAMLARALSRADLAPLLAVPEVAHEEGWILGAGHVAALEAAL